jgi:hypothetical protein
MVHLNKKRFCFYLSNLARGKLPIVCGGTHYWVESLLWSTFMSTSVPSNAPASDPIAFAEKLLQSSENPYACVFILIEKISTYLNHELYLVFSFFYFLYFSLFACVLYTKRILTWYFSRVLQSVDPDMAKRLHPNDHRKIARSIQVLRIFYAGVYS